MIKEIINDTRYDICMLVKLRILKLIHNPVRLEGVPQILAHPHVWVCFTISIFHPDPSFSGILKEGTQNNPHNLPTFYLLSLIYSVTIFSENQFAIKTLHRQDHLLPAGITFFQQLI